jgi:hypothetical protein
MPSRLLPSSRRGDVDDTCFGDIISPREKFSKWICVGLMNPNRVLEKTGRHDFLPTGSLVYELALWMPHGMVVVYVGESKRLGERMVKDTDAHLGPSGLFINLLKHLSFDAPVELLVRSCQSEKARAYEDIILKRLRYPANKKDNAAMSPGRKYHFDWEGLSTWIGLCFSMFCVDWAQHHRMAMCHFLRLQWLPCIES